jgi:hypothetical protein
MICESPLRGDGFRGSHLAYGRLFEIAS